VTESDQYEENFKWSRFWKEEKENWDQDAYVKWLDELQKEYNEDAEKDDGGDAEKANQEPKEQKKYYHLPEVGDIKKLVGDRGEKPGKKISKEAKSYTQERSSQKSDVSLILEWLQQKNILEEHSDSNEETALNEQLLQKFNSAPYLVVCGQARSHCVNYTVRDILANWVGDKSRIILIEDAMNDVDNYKVVGERFISDMRRLGVTVMTTDEFCHRMNSNMPLTESKPPVLEGSA
jgi:nicotinamidase-related amidase